MAEISWIKLKTTMFDDEKIRLIQAVPESDAILVIWIRLLVLAGKTNDWCVTERFTKPFKAVCVKVLENSAIVTFGSDRTVVRLRDMKRVE